jgi:hypothetical protein
MGDMRNAHRTLSRKSEGKRQFDRPMHRWQDNTKKNLKEIRVKRWT